MRVCPVKMAVMEGPLSKWTNVMKGWQYRWFVLDSGSGILSYYTVSSFGVIYIIYSIPHRRNYNEVIESMTLRRQQNLTRLLDI